jgi:hypothetical protein
MTDTMQRLLAAASQAQGATCDMIEAARDGAIRPIDNVGSGDTLTIMADGTRLLIEAMETDDESTTQLYGALVRFLEDRM